MGSTVCTHSICFTILKSAGVLSSLSGGVAAGIVPAIVLLVGGPFSTTDANRRGRAHAGRRHALTLFLCVFFVLLLSAYVWSLIGGEDDVRRAGVLAVPGSVLLDLGAALLFNALAWLVAEYEHAAEPRLVDASGWIAVAVMGVAVCNTSLSVTDAFAYPAHPGGYKTWLWGVLSLWGGGAIAVGYRHRANAFRAPPVERTFRLVIASIVTCVVGIAAFDVLSYVRPHTLANRLPWWVGVPIVVMSACSHLLVGFCARSLPAARKPAPAATRTYWPDDAVNVR